MNPLYSLLVQHIINNRLLNEAKSLDDELNDRISDIDIDDLNDFQRKYDELKETDNNE